MGTAVFAIAGEYDILFVQSLIRPIFGKMCYNIKKLQETLIK